MDMHKHALEDLIRKYEGGDTSLEEEQKLLQYLTTRDADLRYASIQSQFLYFQAQKEEAPVAPITLASLADAHQVERISLGLILRVAALAIVALGIGWWVFLYNVPRTVTTGPHERKNVALPDGTTVYLNSDTELEYDRQFSDNQRAVRLKGEAYFDVQRDATRPFIIQAASVTVEVLGTSFNLRSYSGEEFDALDVRAGHVRFGVTDKIVVEQGGGARFYRHEQRLEATLAQVNADSWKSRKLSFRNAPMKEVIPDLERFYHVTIQVESPSLLKCHITGEFIDHPLTEVLDVIGYSLNIRYTNVDDTYVLSGATCQGQ